MRYDNFSMCMIDFGQARTVGGDGKKEEEDDDDDGADDDEQGCK